MGLDAVEIVMAVEQAFDIEIKDAEAEHLLTPGDVIALIQAKVARVETEVCLSHRAFNLARRLLIEQFGLPRHQITPGLALREVVPKPQRREFLQQVRSRMNAESALALAPSSAVLTLVISFTLLLTATFYGALLGPLGFSGALPLALLGGFIVMLLGMLAARAAATEFPPAIATVGGLAQWIRTHKPDLADKSQRAWTREQIAAHIREIVIAHLDCESRYREDARFIQDLGLS